MASKTKFASALVFLLCFCSVEKGSLCFPVLSPNFNVELVPSTGKAMWDNAPTCLHWATKLGSTLKLGERVKGVLLHTFSLFLLNASSIFK